MRKTIKINGNDFTDYGTPIGYKTTYRKVYGQNAGTTQSGDYVDDVLAWKTDIEWICMPLNEEQLEDVFSEICKNTYCTITFFDPKIKDYRTAEMMASEPSQTYKGQGTDGLFYWTGTSFTFSER